MVVSNIIKHGQLIESGHARWCATHNQEHGVLYPCGSYDEETLREIEKHTVGYCKNLSDPDWCKKQIEKGIPEEGIAIFKALAGVPLKNK